MSDKTWSTTKLDGEPIIVVELKAGFKPAVDLAQALPEGMALLEQQPEPVFYVLDVSQAQLGLEDIIIGANVTSGHTDSIYRHPKIRQAVFVAPDLLFSMATKGLDSEAFGHMKSDVFRTLDDALTHIRAQL